MAKIVRRCVRALFLWIALALSTVVLFDIGCFYVLPEYFSERFFIGYRTGLLPDGTLGRGYPHDYYETHPERGFDIGASKSVRQHHVFNYPKNYSYPIWSNSLGCFDVEHPPLKNYIYLAGDSTTWGYNRFEKKFGTLLEQKLQVPVVKCGVTHTGQIHQLNKMKEVISKIGEPPSVILVVWCPNDIINDAFHPHSTVIDGWQVDTTQVTSGGEIVRDSHDVLAERVRNKVRAHLSLWQKPQWFLIKYSATYNILDRAFSSTLLRRWRAEGMYDDSSRMNIYSLQSKASTTPALSYRSNDLARKNQEALLTLQAYADTIHATLLVALLAAEPNYKAEVGEFLQEHAIRYIDVGDAGYDFNDKRLSWTIDPHANEAGNKVIADVLYGFILSELGDDSLKIESPTN